MISIATLTDAAALEQLVNSAYRGKDAKQGWTTEADLLDGTRITKELVEALLQKKDTVVLTYNEGNVLLGCVELRKEDSKLYLGMLSVKPTAQSKGIGKKLLKGAEDHAKQHNCTSIFMTVIDGRTELIDWYIRHGYRLTGERKPFSIPDERWGIPKMPLEFVVLEKQV
jgi:ribosomal protein S18 acetylase RimI-like enzyme